MKDGVILINTARGTVVDIHAMVRAISNRKAKAAGLDVLPEEPVIREEAELLKTAFRKEHDLTTLLMLLSCDFETWRSPRTRPSTPGNPFREYWIPRWKTSSLSLTENRRMS